LREAGVKRQLAGMASRELRSAGAAPLRGPVAAAAVG
jgi:hypothetical protein